MPTYAYRCARCDHELEAVQKMSDPPLKRCPACKAMKLQRVFHPVGIVLKGPGFYKTDSRSSKPASDAKKDTKPEAKPASTSESKTERKTAETKSTKKDAKST